MNRKLWIASAAAVVAGVAAVLLYLQEVSYLPSILMLVAAITVLGVLMIAEDSLLLKYDTPHDEDKHPPALILLRSGRAIILVVLSILVFVLAF